MKMNGKIKFRIVFLPPAFLVLVFGIIAGVVRLGWQLPIPLRWMPLHGPLMVSGFLGTLIGLERAVALQGMGRNWGYAAPFFTILGTILILARGLDPLFVLLTALGSLGLIAILISLTRLQRTLYHVTMGLGAVLWLLGNLLWLLGFPIYLPSFWWAGFLLLTIAGERLELSRVVQIPERAKLIFASTSAVFLSGLIFSIFEFNAGIRISGLGVLLLALWLLIYDIARRTVHQRGLTRFIALCLLTGFVWLGINGVLSLIFGGVGGGYAYDAMLHSLFLGFVFNMVFGHAPIILPAITGLDVPFKKIFYLHFFILHISLIARVVGDLGALQGLRAWGGVLNAVALIVFLINTISAVILARFRYR